MGCGASAPMEPGSKRTAAVAAIAASAEDRDSTPSRAASRTAKHALNAKPTVHSERTCSAKDAGEVAGGRRPKRTDMRSISRPSNIATTGGSIVADCSVKTMPVLPSAPSASEVAISSAEWLSDEFCEKMESPAQGMASPKGEVRQGIPRQDAVKVAMLNRADSVAARPETANDVMRPNTLADGQQAWSGRMTREAAFTGIVGEMPEGHESANVQTASGSNKAAAAMGMAVMTVEPSAAAGSIATEMKSYDTATSHSYSSKQGSPMVAVDTGAWWPISAGQLPIGSVEAERMPSGRPRSAAATVEASRPLTPELEMGNTSALVRKSSGRPPAAVGVPRPASAGLPSGNITALKILDSRPGLARSVQPNPGAARSRAESFQALLSSGDAAMPNTDGCQELNGEMSKVALTGMLEYAPSAESGRPREDRYLFSVEEEEGCGAEEEEAAAEAMTKSMEFINMPAAAESNNAAVFMLPSSKEFGEPQRSELNEDFSSTVESPAESAPVALARAFATSRSRDSNELPSCEQGASSAKALATASSWLAPGATNRPDSAGADAPGAWNEPLWECGPTGGLGACDDAGAEAEAALGDGAVDTDSNAATDAIQKPAGGSIRLEEQDELNDEHDASMESTDIVPFGVPNEALKRSMTYPYDK